MRYSSQRGQSLIELIVGIGIGVLFITAAIGIITVSLRLDITNKFSQAAGELAQEVVEQVETFANNDWHNLDGQTRDTALSIAPSAGFFAISPGARNIVLEGVTYSTSFTVSDVYRDGTDAFVLPASGTLDPGTLLITATVSWLQPGAGTPQLQLSHYLTRIRDRMWFQTDWSQGSSTGLIVIPWMSGTSTFTGPVTFANATNTVWATTGQLTIYDKTKNTITTSGSGIDAIERYAWNDLVGWFDFRITNTVSVGSVISGYARTVSGAWGTNPIGDLALDCTTSPNGNICGISNFQVVKDTTGTTAGILSGYGWNDGIGWVSFNCSNSNQCATTTPCPSTNPNCSTAGGIDYYVRFDGTYFHGWAWNDIVGWLSFDCDHSIDPAPPGGTNYCSAARGGSGTSDYRVKVGPGQLGRAQLESMILDTTRIGGVGVNTILWQGTQPNDTRVRIQIASSPNSTGPWNFIGPDGTANTFYEPSGSGVQVRFNRLNHNNDRYFRYYIELLSDPAQSNGPTVADVQWGFSW